MKYRSYEVIPVPICNGDHWGFIMATQQVRERTSCTYVLIGTGGVGCCWCDENVIKILPEKSWPEFWMRVFEDGI